MARIRHVQGDNDGALSYWNRALSASSKFHLTSGRTTRIIVISICDILARQGEAWLVRASLQEMASLDQMVQPGGVQYWIAGIRHWLEYLQAQAPRNRL